MSSKPISATGSRTDWKRVDAMGDDEVALDQDTGAALTEADIAAGIAGGFAANGVEDFAAKMKRAAA